MADAAEVGGFFLRLQVNELRFVGKGKTDGVSPSAAGMFSGNINAASVDVAGSRWDKTVRPHPTDSLGDSSRTYIP